MVELASHLDDWLVFRWGAIHSLAEVRQFEDLFMYFWGVPEMLFLYLNTDHPGYQPASRLPYA